MIKKFLLACSALSLAFAANSAEKEIYVIKDGKMVNCNFVPSSEPVEDSYEIEESTNSAGEPMVKVKNPVAEYKQGFLYLPEAVDLSETWNMVFEYYFEEGTELTPDCYKRECWRFDLMADTLPAGDSIWKHDPKSEVYRIAHMSIDAWYRDFYSYVDEKSVLDNHGVGKLRSVTKYVYSSPFMPAEIAKRGDGNKVKAIFLAMFPESKAEIVGYIKTLKFVSAGTKPFYADKMTALQGEADIVGTKIVNYVYSTNGSDHADNSVGEMDFEDQLYSPNLMYGQQLFVSNSPDAEFNTVKGDRMYCDYGEQESVGFFDSEYGFLPYLKAAKKRKDNDGIVADAQLRIPFGDAVKKTISVEMRLGHNAGKTGDLTPYADYKEKSKDIKFPVQYRFESGDAQTISKKTEWKDFRPTYTKDSTDYVDSIPTLMSMVYGDVNLPDGEENEYSYITLRFVTNDVISFMFGDIRLTGDAGVWPKKVSDYELGKDYKGNSIPVGFKSGVENIVAKGEISIYPNPATDVITVTNEGVNSVAVYSVAGSLVASSESNVVNVANLVKGIYVVKANTEAGVITGQIIKK